MSKPRYTREDQAHMPPLTRTQVSCYNETVILNNTRRNIILVDHTNGQLLIPAQMSGYSHEEVLIFDRGGVCATIDERGNPVPISGRVFHISLMEISHNPVFVPELNCIICLEEYASQVTHPYGCVTYEKALDQAVAALADSIKECPTILLSANDPEKRVDELYTVLGDKVISVPVTHVYARNATLTLTILQCGSSRQCDIDIDALFAAEDEYIELETGIFPYVALRKARAAQLLRQYKPLTNKQFENLIKEHEARIKDIIQDHKTELESLKKEYDVKLQSAQNTILLQKDENHKLQQELDEAEAKYAACKGAMNAHADFAKEEFKYRDAQHASEEAEYKVDTARLKHEQAKLEHEEARWKVISTCATLVLGGVGYKVISMVIDKLSEADPKAKLIETCGKPLLDSFMM